MSAPWRLLNQTSSDTELPPLLISTSFSSNSYKVNVTDLTYIWSESLDRRSIIKRSLDEDTSIDPSEDAEQLRVFLDKIQSALSGAENTTLSLQAKSSPKSKDPPSLDLSIIIKLPKGLQPLQWPIHLTPLPQSELSSRLTIPILRAQNARMRELERLVEMLKEKDHVIQKLVDKLETTGAELGHVFPGAAGKGGRKIPRKLAEERVKGLGVFEVEDWKKEMRLMEENSSEDIKVVVKEVYEEDSSLLVDPITYSEAPGSWLNWWDNVKENPVKLSNRTDEQKTKNETAKAPEVQEKNEATAKEDEDDFQVQATPPHLGGGSAEDTDPASSPPTLRSQAVIQDSTDDEDDEDDLDAPSQRSVVPDSVPLYPPRQQPRKLGAIGRSMPAPAPAPRMPIKSKSLIPQATPNGKHTIVDDEETASEDEENPPPAKSPSPPTPASPAPSKAKKGGLGKIGGKAKETTPPSTKAAVEEKTTLDHKPKHKLGVIGHKATTPAPKADEAKSHDAEETRGRGAEVSKEEEREQEPRETSKERADRKREELKRALEEKARAPVKKKRKF